MSNALASKNANETMEGEGNDGGGATDAAKPNAGTHVTSVGWVVLLSAVGAVVVMGL